MSANAPENVHFKLTDDLWEAMAPLEGAAVTSLVIWDSSLVDESLEGPITDETRVYVDFELYLEDHILLELYGAAVLPDENSEALVGLDAIGEALSALAAEGAVIQEICADQEEGMVLVLTSESGASLFVAVTAWLQTTWDTLPEDEL
ncbi:MAG: hypothetical protein HUU23_10235 [Caldilineales bacterium]|nr:hypothetical protein [Caldilineales bacterium]